VARQAHNFWWWRWTSKALALLLLAYAAMSLGHYYIVLQKDRLVRLADQKAEKYSIDKRLFRALITQESAWNPWAVSSVGAAGLTQLMPETAKSVCNLDYFERFHPRRNLDCGARYLSAQLQRFKSIQLALAAYNAGPTRVARLGRIPRIPETQAYVANIMRDLQAVRNGNSYANNN